MVKRIINKLLLYSAPRCVPRGLRAYEIQKRGLRNIQPIINRRETRKENTRNRRRDRTIRSATNRQEWRALARHAAAQLNRPTHQRAFQGKAKCNKHPNNHNRSKTTYIRKLTEDASTPNKLKEGVVQTKIPYKREVNIASINIRGMKDSAKREQLIQQMIRHNIRRCSLYTRN